MQKHTHTILRIGISLVFLWFGITQVLQPLFFAAYVPQWTQSLPIAIDQLLMLNGIFETIVGAMLLLGILTRLSAALLTLHIALIMISIGFNEIGVRDFGITVATLAVALHGADSFTIDKKLRLDQVKFLKRFV